MARHLTYDAEEWLEQFPGLKLHCNSTECRGGLLLQPYSQYEPLDWIFSMLPHLRQCCTNISLLSTVSYRLGQSALSVNQNKLQQ